jgi:subtilisin family serine protease
MEKEYAVIVKRGVDLEKVDAEIAASTGSGPIPNRSVDIANPRLGSRRMTHWMLTDAEAEALRSDPRIMAVEIPPDQRNDIKIELRSSQVGNFSKTVSNNSNVNWGLRRCIDTVNNYNIFGQIAGPYNYSLDGTGIDVVIQDSGIQPDHPEFNDYDGNSRVVRVDWYVTSGLTGTQSTNFYRDRDGHGTHVAGIAAALTYGWAKGAKIYSQKLAGLETLQGPDGTGIPIADAFDSIRLWHLNKISIRPTVVNMSWGYVGIESGDPTNGVYRGTPWTFNSGDNLLTQYGLPGSIYDSGTTARYPVQVAFVDAEIDDMIDAGIHVCIASGNDFYKADVIDGLDYNNTVTHGGNTYSYHRPGSPYSTRAFMVGSIDSATNNGTDRPANYSKKGPAVNIWAPGNSIMSTASNENDAEYNGVTLDYPEDSNFKIMYIGGTSMSSPQVAGLLALYLQSQPATSPENLLKKITNDSLAVIADTGLDDDYSAHTTSLMSSQNRFLYSRYGVANPSIFTGSVLFNNTALNITNTVASTQTRIWTDNNGDPVTVRSIISPVSMQLNGVFSINPTVPIQIEGRSSSARTIITNISANTGTVLEVDDDGNSTSFQVGEELNILT